MKVSALLSICESVEVFVARQAIFDRNRKVWGYELLFRSDSSQIAFDGTEASLATRLVIANSLLAIGLDRLLRGKNATINFGREMLLQEWHSILPKRNTVIEILETVEPDSEVVAAVLRLHEQGYRIALDDFVDHPGMAPLLKVASLIKVEITTPKVQQEAMIRDYHARGLQMLAEKVEMYEEFDWARRVGYDYFQGNFFARPVTVQANQISAAKLSCLRLLQEAHRPEIDFDRLATLISADVSFSYKLIRYANSAGFGRHRRIQSIRRALLVLGEGGIRKWVSIAVMAAVAEDKPSELVTHSLVRARFCELLGRLMGTHIEERAFLMGLFSLLDALLDRPLDEVLAELRVGAPVDTVLLGLAPEQSPLNVIYKLVRGYEAGHWDEVDRLANQLGIPATLIRQAYCDALCWVDEAARS